jgi:hypothetical protein
VAAGEDGGAAAAEDEYESAYQFGRISFHPASPSKACASRSLSAQLLITFPLCDTMIQPNVAPSTSIETRGGGMAKDLVLKSAR